MYINVACKICGTRTLILDSAENDPNDETTGEWYCSKCQKIEQNKNKFKIEKQIQSGKTPFRDLKFEVYHHKKEKNCFFSIIFPDKREFIFAYLNEKGFHLYPVIEELRDRLNINFDEKNRISSNEFEDAYPFFFQEYEIKKL